MSDFNNPFCQGIPYATETLPPEVLQQLEQRRSLMGGAPQQLLGASPPQQVIQVPDIQYSPQMKKQALSQGLMQAGLSMLANMKPTALPQSPFANLGQAGLEGMQAYQGNLNNKMAQALEYAKMQKAMQGDVQKDHYTIREIANKQNVKSVRLTPGESIPPGWEIIPSQGEGVPSYFPMPYLSPEGFPILGERRKGTLQEVKDLGQGPFGPTTTLRPTPQQSKEANFYKSAMQRLQNMARYYKPEYVGIIQGRIANPERKLRELPPDQVKFYREFKQFNDDIIRSNEGAVVPEAMVSRLEQFMNDIKQPSGNFQSQYDSLTDYVRDQMMNLHETVGLEQRMSPFTTLQKRFWENRGSLFGGTQPAQQTPPSGGMTEAQARQALSVKGITGPSADEWIKKYRAAGKIQ